MLRIPFENQYVSLGEDFFARTQPTPVPAPQLIQFNHQLAADMQIDIDGLDADALAQMFSGNQIPKGAEPLAMVYAGHQFGFYTPQLGDGRAILLGEVAGQNGRQYEIQLKGSGRTAFSRNGDGRAPLGPVLREYLVSEAMHRLGVPTTRALVAVATGDQVFREQVLPGGVLTRVSSSFVRVGTFEFHARRAHKEGVQKLADYVINRYFRELQEANNPYTALLETVVEQQAQLIAKWMQIGFIHGVMNTDNMSIVGETIDYGPCAFMDRFAFDRVFSSIDQEGRYAYGNQPRIALWNLARLAECLIPIIDADINAAIDKATQVLEAFEQRYDMFWLEGMQCKCGLISENQKASVDNRSMIDELLSLMHQCGADFTLVFFWLSKLNDQPRAIDQKFLEKFASSKRKAEQWLANWRAAVASQELDEVQRHALMQRTNPAYIPRNHLIEEAIRNAETCGDFSQFHELRKVLNAPYATEHDHERFQRPPDPQQEVTRTFCGT